MPSTYYEFGGSPYNYLVNRGGVHAGRESLGITRSTYVPPSNPESSAVFTARNTGKNTVVHEGAKALSTITKAVKGAFGGLGHVPGTPCPKHQVESDDGKSCHGGGFPPKTRQVMVGNYIVTVNGIDDEAIPLLGKAIIVGAAYHGYRRSGTVLSAVLWAGAAWLAPFLTTGVALAQGYTKPKSQARF